MLAVTAQGTLKWAFADTHNPRKQGLAVQFTEPTVGPDGTVYFVSGSHVYAISAVGKLMWNCSIDDGADVTSSPTVGSDGTLYVGACITGKLYAIAHGCLVWSFKTDGCVGSPVSSPDGSLYFGSDDGYLYAVSQKGALEWKLRGVGAAWSTPVLSLDKQTIYIGGAALYAISRAGNLKWRFDVLDIGREDGISSPAVDSAGTIYVASGGLEGNLYAVTQMGNLKWKVSSIGGGTKPAVGANGTVVAARNFLRAVTRDGFLNWTFRFSSTVRISPTVSADGTVFVGDINQLFAVCDGNVSPPPAPPPSPPPTPQAAYTCDRPSGQCALSKYGIFPTLQACDGNCSAMQQCDQRNASSCDQVASCSLCKNSMRPWDALCYNSRVQMCRLGDPDCRPLVCSVTLEQVCWPARGCEYGAQPRCFAKDQSCCAARHSVTACAVNDGEQCCVTDGYATCCKRGQSCCSTPAGGSSISPTCCQEGQECCTTAAGGKIDHPLCCGKGKCPTDRGTTCQK